MLGFESFAGKARDARSQKLMRQKQKATPAEKQTLKERHPDLARRWHPTKNGGKKSAFVKADSIFRYWWKCPRGPDHEWAMTIKSFAEKGVNWCPCCLNLQVSKTNCLATIAPEVAAQWHPTRNKGNVTPETTLAGADLSAWWKCDVAEDHVWAESIRARTQGLLRAKQLLKQKQSSKGGGGSGSDGGGGGSTSPLLLMSSTTANPMAAMAQLLGDQSAGGGAAVAATSLQEGKENSRPPRRSKVGGGDHAAATPIEADGSGGSRGSSSSSTTKAGVDANDDADDADSAPVAVSNALRTSGACPCCAGVKVSITNCVATVAPTVAAMWHPKRNKVRGVHATDTAMRRLKPAKVLSASTQLCWLRCGGGDLTSSSAASSSTFHDFCVPIRDACARAASGLPNAQPPCRECARDVVARVLRAAANAAVDEAEERRTHETRNKWFKKDKKKKTKKKKGGKGSETSSPGRGNGGGVDDDDDDDDGDDDDSDEEDSEDVARSRSGWLTTMRSKVLTPLVDAVERRRSKIPAFGFGVTSPSKRNKEKEGGGGGGGDSSSSSSSSSSAGSLSPVTLGSTLDEEAAAAVDASLGSTEEEEPQQAPAVLALAVDDRPAVDGAAAAVTAVEEEAGEGSTSSGDEDDDDDDDDEDGDEGAAVVPYLSDAAEPKDGAADGGATGGSAVKSKACVVM